MIAASLISNSSTLTEQIRFNDLSNTTLQTKRTIGSELTTDMGQQRIRCALHGYWKRNCRIAGPLRVRGWSH